MTSTGGEGFSMESVRQPVQGSHSLTSKKIQDFSRTPRMVFLGDCRSTAISKCKDKWQLLTQNVQSGSTIYGRIAEHMSPVVKKVLGLSLSRNTLNIYLHMLFCVSVRKSPNSALCLLYNLNHKFPGSNSFSRTFQGLEILAKNPGLSWIFQEAWEPYQ